MNPKSKDLSLTQLHTDMLGKILIILGKLAKESEMTRSEIIRIAISEFLNRACDIVVEDDDLRNSRKKNKLGSPIQISHESEKLYHFSFSLKGELLKKIKAGAEKLHISQYELVRTACFVYALKNT